MASKIELSRRLLLGALGSGAMAPVLANAATALSATVSSGANAVPGQRQQMGRRKLGALEVSSIGLGVQNMSRTYQTTLRAWVFQ